MNTADVSISPPAAPELRDFSDRLPPVLVKELRQGLRARMFVIPFLLLHGLLVIGTLQAGSVRSSFFWVCLVIMLIALLPMRNLGALSDERHANTLDTLILTRLTPWRIVWGKWSATFALVLLTAVSALPYLLVRYLHGGSSLVMEAAVLAGLVLISGALTAVLTAVSAFPQPLARHGFGVLLIVYACTLGGGSLIRMAQGFSSPTQLIPILITLIIWATLFSLWHAAASIAPAALNLTLPRRLTSLAALLIAAGMVFLSYDAAPILLTILVATSMVEMGDRPSAHPGVGAAFARRGPAGKAAALLFHPGWATGVVFCAGLWLLAWRLLPGSGFARDFASAAALCFFPICAGAQLLARQRSGTVIMILLAAAAHILSLLAEALLPSELKFIARVLPSVRGHDFSPFVAGFWIALALVIATRPLAVMLRRISRESNL